MEQIMIVWNGCDSYVELADAAQRGHDVKGDTLYTQRESFTAFPAVELDRQTLPLVDGEPDLDGVLASESGRLYRAAIAKAKGE